MSTLAVETPGRIYVQRWWSEMPLFAIALALSLLLWVAIIVSIVGLVYGLLLAAVFFVAHVVFVAHVRGNGVRLGPNQLPELYAAVVRLSRRVGLERPPEVYLMQAGGALNAFATRFLWSKMVVLYSDLLEACGENTAARDMIIAHELGHIRAGHLRWRMLTMPAMFVPFLGTALSRAREYTCDRYGLAGAEDRKGGLLGLAILAAGGAQAKNLDLTQLVAQQATLNTGWMTIGEWLSTHPPLAKRISVLDPALRYRGGSAGGVVRAFVIMGSLAVVVVGFSVLAAVAFRKYQQLIEQSPLAGALAPASAQADVLAPTSPQAVPARVQQDFARIATFIQEEWGGTGTLPEDVGELYRRWNAARAGAAPPIDFDGMFYGYIRDADGYRLWSSGPDGVVRTEDDVVQAFNGT